MATTNATAESIISLLMDEVRQSLEPKISHVLADYQTYKETHDAMLQIPFVKYLLANQCKCHEPATQSTIQSPPELFEPIHLEIIDVANNHDLPNLDSISEYINSTIEKNASSDEEEAEAEAEETEEEEDAEEEAEEAEEADEAEEAN